MKLPRSRLLLSTAFTALLLAGCSSSSPSGEDVLQDPTDTPADGGSTGEPADGGSPDTPVDPLEPPTDEPVVDMLVPDVIKGSDVDRLIRGIDRQVSRTLLDLNSRLSQGTGLTPQQNACLGSFDPAQGEQLLAIDCEQPLATGDVAAYVGVASYYDTAACQASVSNGNTANCQLRQATVSLRTQWLVQPMGPPRVAYEGSELAYAMEGTLLQIENTETDPLGAFNCSIDLSNGSESTSLPGVSTCETAVSNAASQLDKLIPE